jgi:hypothetical protein
MRQTGSGFGVPPTGKTLYTIAITVVRIANGQFLEGWQNWDMLGLMARCGTKDWGRPTLRRKRSGQFRWVGV